MRIKIKWLVIIIIFCFVNIATAFAQYPIVYSRCERTTTPYTLTADLTINGVTETRTKTFTNLDILDVLPDVTNFFSNFTAPCDLVYRDAAGDETIIHNCSASSTMESSCAALDPAVSFDGKTIVFSVFKGPLTFVTRDINVKAIDSMAESSNVGRKNMPNKLLKSEGSHLHSYNVDTKLTAKIPYEVGVFDSGPAFITNTRIAFTSTRDGNASTQVWGSNTKPGTRIWTMDTTGKNLDLASHHSLSQEQHPYLLRNGRLAYSSWQIFGGLPFRHTNGEVGGDTTLDNLFHIYTQNPDGSDNFPLYGQHSGDHKPSSFGDNHNAAHFITQTSDERVWFADYYRDNNSGLGILVGVMAEPAGQEGINPHISHNRGDIYVPHDVLNFASWASNEDSVSTVLALNAVNSPFYSDPIPFAGKVGHPAALPANGLMLSWGKGACSTLTKGEKVFEELGLPSPGFADGIGQGVALRFMDQLGLDIPGCDVGIYVATTIPSQHPSDLELIVDSPDWHEIMVRAVVPYTAIHGVEKPEIIPSADTLVTHAKLAAGTPFGLLGAASITDRETHPREGISFAGEHQFNGQGTDTIDYTDEDLCGVRILGVMPNRYEERRYNRIHEIKNIAGERVSILGEFSVKNRDSNGARVIDSSGHPDTSFLVRMPANTPYLMQAIDCDGRTLNTDQSWQSLRPGEMKTCGGCHVHSRPSRIKFDQSFAATSQYVIPQLGEGTVPLLAGKNGDTVNTRTVPGYGVQVDFTRDVLPIFQQRCASCHGENQTAAAGLVLDRVGTNGLGTSENPTIPSTWWCLTSDRSQVQECVAPENVMVTNAGSNGTTFRRPQLTRYVRAFNSRGSLLYWKAANARTDNRTDDSHSDDLDFGDPHPTDITPDELAVISRWIDLGVPGGAKELLDTQKPTLHLAAIVQNGAITGFRVGTVDLGSGINVNSLIVCVRNQSGEDCSSNNIAGPAEMHGITNIAIGSVGADAEIYASVRDMANNLTEVTRTVDWYVD